MRLLVLDQSLILQWLVRHEFPDGVEILSAQDLREAEPFLAAPPPLAADAAVVSLPPAHIPWREFQHRCATHAPPIPVLYETCVDVDARTMGLDPDDGYAAFLHKPAARNELHSALETLLAAAKNGKIGAARGVSEASATELSCAAGLPTTSPAEQRQRGS